MDRYFSFDPQVGFETHKTAEEAARNAKTALGRYRNDEEWPDDVESICWGEIRQMTTETVISSDTDRSWVVIDFILADVLTDKSTVEVQS